MTKMLHESCDIDCNEWKNSPGKKHEETMNFNNYFVIGHFKNCIRKDNNYSTNSAIDSKINVLNKSPFQMLLIKIDYHLRITGSEIINLVWGYVANCVHKVNGFCNDWLRLSCS